jgi:hypothetical protein
VKVSTEVTKTVTGANVPLHVTYLMNAAMGGRGILFLEESSIKAIVVLAVRNFVRATEKGQCNVYSGKDPKERTPA